MSRREKSQVGGSRFSPLIRWTLRANLYNNRRTRNINKKKPK